MDVGRVASASERIETSSWWLGLVSIRRGGRFAPDAATRPAFLSGGRGERWLGYSGGGRGGRWRGSLGRWSSSERQRAYRDQFVVVGVGLDTQRGRFAPGLLLDQRFQGRLGRWSSSERQRVYRDQFLVVGVSLDTQGRPRRRENCPTFHHPVTGSAKPCGSLLEMSPCVVWRSRRSAPKIEKRLFSWFSQPRQPIQRPSAPALMKFGTCGPPSGKNSKQLTP